MEGRQVGARKRRVGQSDSAKFRVPLTSVVPLTGSSRTSRDICLNVIDIGNATSGLRETTRCALALSRLGRPM